MDEPAAGVDDDVVAGVPSVFFGAASPVPLADFSALTAPERESLR